MIALSLLSVNKPIRTMASDKGTMFNPGFGFKEQEGATPLAYATNRRSERPRSDKRTIYILALAISFMLSLYMTFDTTLSRPRALAKGPIDWTPCEEDETILCGFLECVHDSTPHLHLTQASIWHNLTANCKGYQPTTTIRAWASLHWP